jgi:hypothetical protein
MLTLLLLRLVCAAVPFLHLLFFRAFLVPQMASGRSYHMQGSCHVCRQASCPDGVEVASCSVAINLLTTQANPHQLTGVVAMLNTQQTWLVGSAA